MDPQPGKETSPTAPPDFVIIVNGGRVMTQAEIDLVNEIEAHSQTLQALVEKIKAAPDIDQRWAAEAKTDLQKGLMSLVRAVTRPQSF